MNPLAPLSLFRLAFGLLGLAALGRQLLVQVQMGFSVVNFFSYFTNLSNLFAALVLIGGAIQFFRGADRSKSYEVARVVSVVNMGVVGVVYVALLRNVDLGALLPWVNVVLHYVMPCVVVLDWLVQPSKPRPKLPMLLLCQIFPVIYLTYVLTRAHSTGWVPYPFLDPAKVGGYPGVASYSVGIAVTFLVASWCVLALGHKRYKGGDDPSMP